MNTVSVSASLFLATCFMTKCMNGKWKVVSCKWLWPRKASQWGLAVHPWSFETPRRNFPYVRVSRGLHQLGANLPPGRCSPGSEELLVQVFVLLLSSELLEKAVLFSSVCPWRLAVPGTHRHVACVCSRNELIFQDFTQALLVVSDRNSIRTASASRRR